MDKTPSRARKRTSLLKHRYLKKYVFPSIFPNCPQYLKKKIQVRQSSCTTSKQREVAVIERAKTKEKQDQLLDCVNSVTDNEKKIVALESPLLKGLKFITSDYGITIYKHLINDEGFPIVKHALVVADNMTFKAWNDGKTVPKTRFKQIGTDELFSFTKILLYSSFQFNLYIVGSISTH